MTVVFFVGGGNKKKQSLWRQVTDYLYILSLPHSMDEIIV